MTIINEKDWFFKMKIILLIIIAISVTAIYDARKIGENFFSSADKNKVAKFIKVIGLILCIICGVVFCVLSAS